jgi:hypothetical protein
MYSLLARKNIKNLRGLSRYATITPKLFQTVPKFNFTMTKNEEHYDIRITQTKDIEELKKDASKLEGSGIHLTLNPKLTKERFTELFDVLSKTNQEELHLDISDVSIEDEKVGAIKNCLSKWNLKHIELHLSNMSFSDSQFKEMLTPLKNMKNLYFLHLELDNINLNRKKREIIDDVVNNIQSLRNVYINIRRTQKGDEDVEVFSRLLDKIPFRRLLL